MTQALVIFGVLTLVVLLERNQHRRATEKLIELHVAERGRILSDAAEERRALADRIQHPERVQVQPMIDMEPFEPPEDLAEMAYIGQIVPDHVQVGTPNPGPEPED
jgi:hypothetical protein